MTDALSTDQPGTPGTDLASLVASVPAWRHRIELPGGITTPGSEDCLAELARLQLPADMSGMRVLDVGCSDGFYSFECERRGAQVVSVDDESSLLAGGVNGFQVAATALGSSADYRVRDVHDLSPDLDGMFDLVLFVNVLYHLRNPVLALERLASVTSPGGLMVLKTYFRSDVRLWVRGRCVSVDLDRRPKFWFFPTTELAGDPTNWFAPNRAAVAGLLSATGWSSSRRTGQWRDRVYVHATR